MRWIVKMVDSFAGLIAVILSIALVIVLMTVPVFTAAHTAFVPETLQDLLLSVTQQLGAGEPADPQAALIPKLLETQMAKDLLGLYVDDLFARLDGGTVLTAQAIRELAEKNMDELVPMLREMAGEAGMELDLLSDAELKTFAAQLVDFYAEQILDQLPTPARLGIATVNVIPPVFPQQWNAQSLRDFWLDFVDYLESIWVMDIAVLDRLSQQQFLREDLSMILTQGMLMLQNYRGLHLLCLTAVILSALIFLLRLGDGCRCFSWLAVDYVIGGLMVFGLAFVIKLRLMSLSMTGSFIVLYDTIMAVLKHLMLASGFILVVGIVFAVIASIGNSILNQIKRK